MRAAAINGYLRTACDYVHLNPVRAKLLEPEDRLLAYPWSSFPLYAAARKHRPGCLRVDRLLGWTTEDLSSRAKSDPLKLALAARLHRETILSIKRIAERLNLGKPKGAKSNSTDG